MSAATAELTYGIAQLNETWARVLAAATCSDSDSDDNPDGSPRLRRDDIRYQSPRLFSNSPSNKALSPLARNGSRPSPLDVSRMRVALSGDEGGVDLAVPVLESADMPEATTRMDVPDLPAYITNEAGGVQLSAHQGIA
mmetsp:Transcript_38062/g.82449  ORF Transcript_38062/g.82449 Transcript_38062/m.82449 type:complete len:139 (+) Transcript_38062:393-809(+)